MRQVLQSLRNGRIEVVDSPCPSLRPGQLLIRTRCSLISAGTERMLLEFGKAGLISKARQQPDKVKQALHKIATDGLTTTLESIQNRLEQPLAVGYCNVGTVLEVGEGVAGFEVGDRVVSNGPHAEVVCVPKLLAARIPDNVDDEQAVFTIMAAIGLQGIRLAEPTLGESFVVSGLGLIGLLTVQLLKAHGCRVLGLDFDAKRVELAARFGAEAHDLSTGSDALSAVRKFSRGRGVDGVLITASTKSSEPVHQAAQMCRKRGRIVLVGVTGLELTRADFYEKELTFQVSCSYGPGRYDADYEQRGHDYPVGHVRWTEQRNFEAVLDAMSAGSIETQPLISHRFAQCEAAKAYECLSRGGSALGIVLNYPLAAEVSDESLRTRTICVSSEAGRTEAAATPLRVAFIGAGNFACRVLMPAFRRAGVELHCVASEHGLSAAMAARRFGFAASTSDIATVMDDPRVDAVVVATRHDSHAELACQALEAGKYVFVEKPLAIDARQLERVVAAYVVAGMQPRPPVLTVGFNRRFSPHANRMRSLLAGVPTPKSFVVTVNAGPLPPEHWMHHRRLGGGRIIGEGCHFIDLLRFLAGSEIVGVQATALSGGGSLPSDCVIFSLQFADGSVGTVHYLTQGHARFPKERVEVFCEGRILQLDNFRTLRGLGWSGFRKMKLWKMDKGHAAGVQAFVDAARGTGPKPIAFDELLEVSQAAFDVVTAVECGQPVVSRNARCGRQQHVSGVAEPVPELVTTPVKRSA